MKKLNIIYFVLGLALFSLLFSGCKEEEPTPEPAISVDFSLENTTWFFQTVAAEGTILGTPAEDKDNMPEGFVTFNADGTGIFNFQIELLNMDYGKIDEVTWERVSDTAVTIVESDGDINEWTLIRANENVVEASWELRIATDTAVFTAELTAEE